MKHPAQRSTSRLAALAAVMIMPGLAGCQTLVTTATISERLAPLDRALAVSPASLEAEAEAGGGAAQLSLSLVLAHGLNGHPVDTAKAAEWRAKALDSRRMMPVTQYTAAFNGQPSRVNIINVPTYELTHAQAAAADACIMWLSGRSASPEACGETEEARRRQALWATARP